jgi:hypothetical protein
MVSRASALGFPRGGRHYRVTSRCGAHRRSPRQTLRRSEAPKGVNYVKYPYMNNYVIQQLRFCVEPPLLQGRGGSAKLHTTGSARGQESRTTGTARGQESRSTQRAQPAARRAAQRAQPAARRAAPHNGLSLRPGEPPCSHNGHSPRPGEPPCDDNRQLKMSRLFD